MSANNSFERGHEGAARRSRLRPPRWVRRLFREGPNVGTTAQTPTPSDTPHLAPGLPGGQPPQQSTDPPQGHPLVCVECGLIDDPGCGVPHVCSGGRQGLTTEWSDPSMQPELMGEITAYLTSDQGFYDALVAALIIRAR